MNERSGAITNLMLMRELCPVRRLSGVGERGGLDGVGERGGLGGVGERGGLGGVGERGGLGGVGKRGSFASAHSHLPLARRVEAATALGTIATGRGDASLTEGDVSGWER